MKTCLCLFLLIISAAVVCKAEAIHVPGDYATIQAAVDECRTYDIILLAPGTYTGAGNRDISIGCSVDVVTILGGGVGPEDVVIDIQGTEQDQHRGFIIQGCGWVEVNIANLTVANACSSEDIPCGAGIAASEVLLNINDCIFRDNRVMSSLGGAAISTSSWKDQLNCYNSLFVNNRAGGPSGVGGAITGGCMYLSDCIFSANTAKEEGGAVLCFKNLIADGCTFQNNSLSNISASGSAVSCHAYASITDCTFESNSTTGFGGAVWGDELSYFMMKDCIFRNNSAGEGGALEIWGSRRLDITNCLFSENTAQLYGGAVVLSAVWGDDESEYCHLWNCTFTKNTANYKGGALTLDEGYLAIENCIFWENPGPSDSEIEITDEFFSVYPARLKIDHSIIRRDHCQLTGNVSLDFGDDNIAQSPDFVDPAGDYRLSYASVCIDNGLTDGAPDRDLDGSMRPVGSAVDIGAYEYQTAYAEGLHLFMADTDLIAGDEFNLELLAVSDEKYPELNAVLVLEIADQFYFYPEWKTAFSFITVPMNYKRWHQTAIDMVWPSDTGSAYGLRFYGALLTPEDMELVGDVASIQWTYQ